MGSLSRPLSEVNEQSVVRPSSQYPSGANEIRRYLVDKLPTGFMVWSDRVKGYKPPYETSSPFSWDPVCTPALEAIKQAVDEEPWLRKLSSLWAQESNGAANTTTDVRFEHLAFIKSLCMWVYYCNFRPCY